MWMYLSMTKYIFDGHLAFGVLRAEARENKSKERTICCRLNYRTIEREG